MHDSKLGAQTWLLGLFLIVANPKGRSSVQLAVDLGITQKSAWHVSHRIRKALAEDYLPGFEGPIEVDEAWIGGKETNKHANKKHTGEKMPVFGVIDNASGQAAAVAVHEVTAPMAAAIVRAVAAAEGIEVHTDGSNIYNLLATLGYEHQTVLHGIGQYVNDNGATTNHVENYWSTLKRIYVGTYHWWSDEHLHRYLEEHTFRFNRRRCHVVGRMAEATQSMSGKRLSWEQLTRH